MVRLVRLPDAAVTACCRHWHGCRPA